MGDDGVCESNRSDARLASEDRRAGATWAEDQRVQLTGQEREKEPVPEGRGRRSRNSPTET